MIWSCLGTDDPERDWAAVRATERRRVEVCNRFRAEAGGDGGVAGITEATRVPQTSVVGKSQRADRKQPAEVPFRLPRRHRP